MERRKFIKQSSLVGLGLLSTGSAMSAISLGEKKELSIAVIGTGGRGKGLISIINNIENLKLEAICDVLPFRIEQAKDRIEEHTKIYTEYKELLNDRSIDAVVITTPFSTHHKIAMDAINAGKHVYCEKTLAKGIYEINQLVDKVEHSNVIFQTGHQYHSSRLYNHIVTMLQDKEIGEIRSFECRWYRKGNWRRWVPAPKEKYERAVNWRMYREFSGGLTAELSSHQIDFVNWVLGATPTKIMGTGSNQFWDDGRETYDTTNLIFDYPNGVKANFKCFTSDIPGGYQIKVTGDKGVITIQTHKAWINYYKPYAKVVHKDVDGVSGATMSGDYTPGLGSSIEVEHLEPTKQALVDFRDAIISNTQPLSNIYTGANTAKAVDLALKAMLTGTVQHWQ